MKNDNGALRRCELFGRCVTAPIGAGFRGRAVCAVSRANWNKWAVLFNQVEQRIGNNVWTGFNLSGRA